MAVFTAIATSLATAIGVAASASATFIAITAGLLQITAGIAVSLIAKSLAGEPQAARFAVQGQIQGGDDVPRSINLGWNCTAGSKVYQNEWGTGGVYSTRVIAIGDYPVRELRSVEVDGSPVTLGTVAHATLGYPALEYRKGGKDHLWFKFYDGTQTTADAFLVASVSSVDRPYDDDRIGFGIPYVIATSLAPERVDGEEKALFQGFPDFKFITYGAKLYDISKDSTAGGSGTQRWATPSTWGGDGDFLPPVQIYNLLRGIRFGGQWLYGLQDVSAARLPQDNWVAQINKARALKGGPSGNEPQYRAGGEIQVGAPIHLAIEALLTSCQGRLVETGGSYKIHVGESDAAVMAFTDGDILSSEEQSFTPFFGLADTINGVSATYPNPAEGWNSKTAPPLLRPDLEIKDGNRRLMASVSLDMVPYGGQVQRLMKSALLEALRARRHTFVLGPEFRVLEAGDVVQWTSVRNGYEDKLFRVDGIVYKSNLDVIVDITEVDPADYDWDQETDYTPVIDGSLVLVGPRPMPMTGWQVFPAIIKDEQGRDRRPSIEVWFATGLSDVRAVRVQVRIDGTTDVVFDGEIPYGDPWKTVLSGQFTPDTAYEVRGIFVRNSGSTSDWSAWLDVVTPDTKLLSGVDFDPFGDVVGLDMVSKELQNAHGIVTDPALNGSIPQQLAALTALAEQLAAALMDVSATAKERLDILNTTIAGSNAAVIRNEKAIVTETTARAEAITEVLASVGDVIADGYLKFEADVNESDSSAQISAKVKASSGSNFSSATWILRAQADGLGGTQSYFGVLGNFYVFSDLDGAPIPVFAANLDGTVTMKATKVETITAGKLQSPDGKFLIDLTNKRISIST